MLDREMKNFQRNFSGKLCCDVLYGVPVVFKWKTSLINILRLFIHEWNLQTMKSEVGETDEAQKLVWELSSVEAEENLKKRSWLAQEISGLLMFQFTLLDKPFIKASLKIC